MRGQPQSLLPRIVGALLAVALFGGLAVPGPLRAAEEPYELSIPVLIYHHVSCDPASDLPNTHIWICPTKFERQLAHLRELGWRTITTDELADAIHNRTCPGPRRFVVTIDDSAAVGYTKAAPILERLGMRATYFVVVGLAGRSSALSFAQMRDLLDRGHAIGNHSMTHLDLVGRSEAALYEEVEAAQQVLDDKLGFRPRTFAYPNGTHDEAARSRVRESGFELAFTADPTFVVSSAKRLQAPRLFVSRRHDPAELAARIEPYAQPCPAVDGPTTGEPNVALPEGARIGTAKVRIRVDWSAGAAPGATGFQLQQSKNGGTWKSISLPSAKATAVNLLRRPGNTFRYRVRATTGGGYGSWATGPPFKLLARQENHTSISLSGAWRRVSNSSAFGGALSYATGSSARATFSFRGSGIGWVAPRGPKRGLVDVYIDGAPAATVDLYASASRPRRLVFVRSWPDAGEHTIELRVRGTSGRPRGDVDAFVVLRP